MKAFAIDMMRAFIFAMLMLLAVIARDAQAQTVAPDAAHISWMNATQDTAGNTLPASGPGSIRQTRIQRSFNCTASSFGTAVETLNVLASVNSVLFENLPAGKWCYRARHVQNAPVAGDPDIFSAWSATLSKVSNPAPPPAGPPTAPISITVE